MTCADLPEREIQRDQGEQQQKREISRSSKVLVNTNVYHSVGYAYVNFFQLSQEIFFETDERNVQRHI